MAWRGSFSRSLLAATRSSAARSTPAAPRATPSALILRGSPPPPSLNNAVPPSSLLRPRRCSAALRGMVPRHALFSLRRCLHTFDGPESIVYKQSMFRRPSTVAPETVYPLRLSCSLIGTVVLAPQKSDRFRPSVYTYLEVEGPSVSSTPSKFRILLNMLDQLAEISFKHLKVDDFIYVRGPLSSYEKLNINGQLENMYKIVVEDLNFVYHIGENKKLMNPDKLIKEESTAPISFDREEETIDRLRLWQIFFANPHEWWDNRKRKLYPNSPDFRHKDTHERLRLMPNDPPWIQRQLQRYDSSTATLSDKEDRKYSKVHRWEIQDLE